jgi:integrase/recombinase XerD
MADRVEVQLLSEPLVDGGGEPVERLLERYRRYLLDQRRLDVATVRGYVDRVRPFVASRATGDGLDLAGLRAADVNAFVLSESRRRARGSAKLTVTALRSLLRWLQFDGVVDEAVAEGVPSVAGWRMAGLPRHLEPDEVQALLSSCDTSTARGLRDLALLKLLVRLGLRRCEIVRLELDDIDWRAGELVIRGKRDRRDQLPLPDDVGQALVSYLRAGRPAGSPDRHVFLAARPPHGGITGVSIAHAVARARVRAGLGEIGTHRLRHTAATTMLASGIPLAQIGQVLRHRHAAATAIYAKVDRDALRAIARPWPGAMS